MDLAQLVRTELGPDARVQVRLGTVNVRPTDATRLMRSSCLHVEWTPTARQFIKNRGHDHRDDVEISLLLKQTTIGDLRNSIADCRLAGLLDDHQVRNVAVMSIPGSLGASVFDEQGTGKTVSLIAAFDVLIERNEVDALVVVSPKSMVGEWASEISRFTTGLYRVETLIGTRSQRGRQLAAGADVYVCNYETVLRHGNDLRLLCQQKRVVIAVDESFNVKNPEALRTAAVTELREWCARAFVLCGTPAPNRPDDIISQVSFVDFGRAFSTAILPDDPDERRTAIGNVLEHGVVFTRNLKSVVLPGLPGRTFTELIVELGPAQRTLYDDVAHELVVELSNASDTHFRAHYSHFLARRASLLRICSDPHGVDPTFTDLPSKVIALDQLLEEWITAGEKVVVWSFYRATLSLLEQRYRHWGVARVDGSVHDVSARSEAVRSFQSDAETRLFIGNPAAAGAGITLHSAALCVYESMSGQAAHYLQSLDRIHRRGQQRDVEYVALLAPRTLEEREFERLKEKASQQASLLGDPQPQLFTREMLLDDLLRTIHGGTSDARH